MNLSARGVTDHGSGNRKPPFTEQNTRVKVKSFDQTQKKPLNYLNTFPTYEDAGYRSEWGVKITDEAPVTQEMTEEQFPKYILKQKWGVNLLEPMSLQPKRVARQSSVPKLTDAIQTKKKMFDTMKKDEMTGKSDSTTDSTAGLTTDKTADQLKPLQERNPTNKQTDNDTSIIKSGFVLNTDDTVGKDDNYNDPKDMYQVDEVSAWQDVIIRTKEHIKKLEEAASLIKNESVEVEAPELKFSILPEPPKPKLDIAAVRTMNLGYQNYFDPLVYDGTDGPTAMGVRIALHEINGQKNYTRTSTASQAYQPVIKNK